MSEFIDFEAEIEGNYEPEMDDYPDNFSENNSFIDDSEIDENERNFNFENVQIEIEKANEEIEREALLRIADCEDYLNLSYDQSDNEEEEELFDFDSCKEKIEKFKKNLLPDSENPEEKTFLKAILYKIRQLKEDKTSLIPLDDFQNNEITKNIFDLITEQNLDFSLDVSIFESNCYSINQILANYGLFLRVYELKNNYRKFTIKTPNKQNQIKQLASCILQKFNGFEILKNEFAKREKQNLIPVDIIYIPTKNVDTLPECYYTTEIQNAYTTLYQDNGLTRRSFLAYECYYCNKFFCRKDKHLRHFKVCTSKPGITYNFCTKTLCSYEDNFKSKGDVPFSIYFDFETTAPTDSDWLNHEDKKNVCRFIRNSCRFPPIF